MSLATGGGGSRWWLGGCDFSHKGREVGGICSEPFTRQPIVYIGRPICSMNYRVSGTGVECMAPVHSLDEQIRAMIVRAILISLAPRYLKWENRLLEISEVS